MRQAPRQGAGRRPRIRAAGRLWVRHAGTASPDSDIDLIVESPPGTSSFEFDRFKQMLAKVLGRAVDLIEYGGLKPRLEDDIRRDAVLL